MKGICTALLTLCTSLFLAGCRMDEPEGTVTGLHQGEALADPDIKWSTDSFKVIIGEDTIFPSLTNGNNVEVSYSSSDNDVALISQEGVITLCGSGTTTITATSVKNGKFDAASVSYTLIVLKTNAGIYWSENQCTVIMGEQNVFPCLNNPNDLKITYTSSNENAARISPEGVISLVAEGTSVISATSQATDKFDADEVSFTLTVKTEQTQEKAEAGLEWSESSITIVYGEQATLPQLANPNSLPINYSSSNEDVVRISAEGEVIVISSGTVTIIASSEGNENFNACSVFYKLTILKAESTVRWSENSFTATIDAQNTFPVLYVEPEGLPITYSSGDESVASISLEGAVTPVSSGSTTITASFSGNDIYSASTSSYILTVVDGSDSGAGTYSYPSTGDVSSNDDIVNTTFTRKITITFSTQTNATVTGDYYGYVTVQGNDVTVNNTGSEYIVYELKGSTDDGFLKIYSTARQALLLNSVSITNRSGAAINNQSRKRTFVMVEGTNTLTDGSSYTETSSTEDQKAAFFSEGQLVFSGSGSLTVNASGKSAITSDDYIRVMNSPSISATSTAGHAMRGQKSIQIDAGTIYAKTSADMKKGFSSDSLVVFNGGETRIDVTGGTTYDSEDADYTSPAGIKADKLFYMNGGDLTITNSGAGGKGINVGSNDTSNDCKAYFCGGNIDITCSGAYYTTGECGAKGIKIGKKFSSTSLTGDMYVSGGVITVRSIGTNSSRDSGNEAVESKGVIEVSGGELFAYSTSDDAINSADDFTVTDGYVCGISTGNDALDSNGNFYVKGGVVMAASARSPEVGIDANTEGGKKLYVTGGVLFVTGGLESGASLTQSCYKSSSYSKGVWYGLTVGSRTYAFKTHSNASGSTLVVSGSQTPTLKSGITVSGGTTYFDGYANRDGSYSGGSSISLSSYTGSSSGGPGGGGRN